MVQPWPSRGSAAANYFLQSRRWALPSAFHCAGGDLARFNTTPLKAYPHAAMECRHRAPFRANPKTQETRRSSLMQRYVMATVGMLGGADTGLVYGERAVQ